MEDFEAIYVNAICIGHAEDMHRLLSYEGFMVDQHSELCCTALQSVARAHKPEGVFVLLAHGANVNTTDKATGNTVLHDAISTMNCAVSANPGKCQDLHAAAVVKLLVYYGADIHALNNENETALHLAAKAADPDVVRFLLDQGAYVDLRLESKAEESPPDIAWNNISNWNPRAGMSAADVDAQGRSYSTTDFVVQQAVGYHNNCIAVREAMCCPSYATIHNLDATDLAVDIQQEWAKMTKPSKMSQTPREIFQDLFKYGGGSPDGGPDRWTYPGQVDVGGCRLVHDILEEERTRQ